MIDSSSIQRQTKMTKYIMFSDQLNFSCVIFEICLFSSRIENEVLLKKHINATPIIGLLFPFLEEVSHQINANCDEFVNLRSKIAHFA